MMEQIYKYMGKDAMRASESKTVGDNLQETVRKARVER